MYRITVVDDEPAVVSALTRLLRLAPRSAGCRAWECRVTAFTDPAEALRQAAWTSVDLVISDYRMPGMTGVELLRELRRLQPDCARVILSGYADLDGLVGAINEACIDRFVAKPWNDFELLSALGSILAMRDLRMDNDRLADQARRARGQISPEELEARRLERLEPGITRVHWAADGSVLVDMDGVDATLLDHDD